MITLIKSVKSTAEIVRTPIELERYEPVNSIPVKKVNIIDILINLDNIFFVISLTLSL